MSIKAPCLCVTTSGVQFVLPWDQAAFPRQHVFTWLVLCSVLLPWHPGTCFVCALPLDHLYKNPSSGYASREQAIRRPLKSRADKELVSGPNCTPFGWGRTLPLHPVFKTKCGTGPALNLLRGWRLDQSCCLHLRPLLISMPSFLSMEMCKSSPRPCNIFLES